MSESRAKELRRQMRESGERVSVIRSRVTRGEVENMISDLRMEIVGSLEDYREEAILPVLRLATRRAAVYMPLYLRVWVWLRMKLFSRRK